jgi:hypothetical protein
VELLKAVPSPTRGRVLGLQQLVMRSARCFEVTVVQTSRHPALNSNRLLGSKGELSAQILTESSSSSGRSEFINGFLPRVKKRNGSLILKTGLKNQSLSKDGIPLAVQYLFGHSPWIALLAI